MTDHKSRTAAEHREHASSVMKRAGYASGGSVKSAKEVTINVQTGNGEADKRQALQQGMQMGARMVAQKLAQAQGAGAGPAGPPPPPPGGPAAMPPRPPMPMPPPGGPPQGAGPMAKGGIVHVRAHSRRKGGACD